MSCTVVNSQTQVQSRLPTLPQTLPKTQADWNALLAALNQWGAILQQESHAPNVIPSQFQTFNSSASAAVIAALSAANTTPSLDAGTQYYGAASLKVAIGAANGSLGFAGYPISIAGGSRWFCAFQIYAPNGCTGSLTVKTANATITEGFTVGAEASWQQVWGLFDLRKYADTQATWQLTFTSTQTVWLDGLQMNAVGSPIGTLPKFAGTQMVSTSLANAANLDGVPDGTTYERMPGANMDGNRRGLIDFTQAGHVAKNLDNIGDSATYLRFLASYLDATRRVSVVKGAISPLGCIPPGASTMSFSYSSTPTTVTFSWTAGVIYRPDGTTTNVAAGNQTITGLSASSTYYLAVYYDEIAGSIKLVSGASGSTGAPAMGYPSKSAAAAAGMIANTAATFGWYTVTTPASGSGGGGGSPGCCLNGSQPIELADGSVIAARDLTEWHTLTSPEGSVGIVKLRFEPWGEWFRVTLSNGASLLVAGDHRFIDPSGEQLYARELRLQQIVAARKGYVCVVKLEAVWERATKVSIEVTEPHTYYVRGILSHNKELC